MRININTVDNGYIVSRESNGGFKSFELFFNDYEVMEAFIIKLLERQDCISVQ